MQAVFGKLDGDSLRFRDGLNVISAPNEWGKSTWCAFLRAMLYGIDTRQRTSREQLSEKEQYAPWSGRPMEGRLRIFWQGRDITLERSGTPKSPFSQFRAYETESGIPVPELTAENCGQRLLGVEKSVFQRTCFLRLTELSAPADNALRTRLASLVTTGDGGDGEMLGRRLRELKNRCRRGKTGLIPEAMAELQALEQRLAEQTALGYRTETLQTDLAEKTKALEELKLHLAFLDWQRAQADGRHLQEAHAKEAEAWRDVRALEQTCAAHPPRQTLVKKTEETRALLSQLDQAAREEAPASGAFPLLFALIFGLGALFFLQEGHPAPAMGLLLAAAVCGVFAVRGLRRAHGDRIRRRAALAGLEPRKRKLLESLALWEGQLEELDALEQARRALTTARSHRETLQSMVRTAPEPVGTDPLTLSRPDTEGRIAALEPELRHLRTELARCAGRAQTQTDPEELRRRISGQKARLQELLRWERALELALECHKTASEELRRRFAPKITRLAEEYLRGLTDGAYDRITFDENLTVRAARSEETALREARCRSDGTGDLLYLALRLALWQTVCPEAPLILDDALARLDNGRLERALELLAQLADTGQILLFSCQTREKEWMDR